MPGAGLAAAFAGAARPVAVADAAFRHAAWTLFRAPDMQAALRMYAGQFGLHGLAMGDTLHALLRPGHAVAAVVGVVCVILPAFRPHWEALHAGTRLAAVIALWPIPAFLLSFALIASRGAVPCLYFQF